MSVFVRIVKYNWSGNQELFECFSNQEDRDEKRHKCMCVGLMYDRVGLAQSVACPPLAR